MWWLRASRPHRRVGAPWLALLSKVSFVCMLTEDLQSILTAHLGRTFVLEGIFGSFFSLGKDVFWTEGGGGCLSSFLLVRQALERGPPCLDVGAGLSWFSVRLTGNEEHLMALLLWGKHRNSVCVLATLPCLTFLWPRVASRVDGHGPQAWLCPME